MSELTVEQQAQAVVKKFRRYIGGDETPLPVEVLDAIAAALREAERAQMERDCAADCHLCAPGGPAVVLTPHGWVHEITPDTRPYCGANDIRAAWAAAHPESANG